MNPVILRCEGLSCERDERVLFRGLCMEVRAGDLLQVVGPNGAGKSSLLRIVAGLLGYDEGQLSWPAALSGGRDFRQDLLFLGHRTGVRDELSALENLAWWCCLHRQPRSLGQRQAALEQVGLRGFEDVPVATLSAGQTRRVMLALLWLVDKPVWLLDEPFTALDTDGVAQLEARLREHAGDGGTVIYSSHHRLSDQVRHLRLGEGEGGWSCS